MADHRAEQILDALKTTLTNLATTGENVFKSRAYTLGESKIPGISIEIDSDLMLGEYNNAIVDRELNVNIDAYVIPTDDKEIDTWLNQIRKEVTIAINADRTLGLSFVVDTDEQDANYSTDGEASNPIGILSTKWAIHYRRSMTDPSA